jgi:hypothetical protein
MSSKLIAVFVFLALMRAVAQTVITLAGGSTTGTLHRWGRRIRVGTAELLYQPTTASP